MEEVAELRLRAARMAASCVRSCRLIHVVSRTRAEDMDQDRELLFWSGPWLCSDQTRSWCGT